LHNAWCFCALFTFYGKTKGRGSSEKFRDSFPDRRSREMNLLKRRERKKVANEVTEIRGGATFPNSVEQTAQL
jgi:hypothetical protein